MKKTFSNPFTGRQEVNDVSELFAEIQKTQSPTPIDKPLKRIHSSEEKKSSVSKETQKEEESIPVRPYGRTPERTVDRTPVRQRILRRYAFEFYIDQIDVLKKMKLEKLNVGEDMSMSKLVRDALDEYIRNL